MTGINRDRRGVGGGIGYLLLFVVLAFFSGYRLGRSASEVEHYGLLVSSRDKGKAAGEPTAVTCPEAPSCPPCPKTTAVVVPPANRAKPKTVDQARKKIAEAVMDAWDMKRDKQIFTKKKIDVSVPRYLVDLFMNETSRQLTTVGPVCMDWSNRYVNQFAGCKHTVNYEYSADASKNEYIPAGDTSDGVIRGDMGEDMSHVPDQILDFVVCTQVFEHIPHFWNAMPNLARMVKPQGVMLFTVPWAYSFHPDPGDFYRYSPMAVTHLLESNGFAVCHMVSDGWRSLQMHVMGLTLKDIRDETYLTKKQDKFSLVFGASNYDVVAQRVDSLGDPCQLPTKLTLTNELKTADLKKRTKGFWVSPMKNFPYSTT